MSLEEKSGEATFFLLHPTSNHCESMFLGASPMKPFHFTPFSKKRLQTVPEAGEEAMPNGALKKAVFYGPLKSLGAPNCYARKLFFFFLPPKPFHPLLAVTVSNCTPKSLNYPQIFWYKCM
jgi:hypothetical protein